MVKTLKDKFNQFSHRLAEKLPLHRLSDENLRLVMKTSKIAAALAVGHAGIWLGLGVIGGVAIGLHAAGYAVPAFIGVGTLAVGGLLAVKSVVLGGLLSAIHKGCTAVHEKRHGKTPAPTAPEPGSKLAATPALSTTFAAAASLASAGLDKAPEAKPVNTAPKP